MLEEEKIQHFDDFKMEPAMTSLEIDYICQEMVDDIMVMGEWNNWMPEAMNMEFTPDSQIRYFI
jgi:peroxiredoxin